MTVCGNPCRYYSIGDCSKYVSDKADFVQTLAIALNDAHSLENSYIKSGLNSSFIHPINQWLIQLDDSLYSLMWDLLEYSNEQTVDEIVNGCYARYPFN